MSLWYRKTEWQDRVIKSKLYVKSLKHNSKNVYRKALESRCNETIEASENFWYIYMYVYLVRGLLRQQWTWTIAVPENSCFNKHTLLVNQHNFYKTQDL